jgi:thiol-disulfide isomerase/thioredoxin
LKKLLSFLFIFLSVSPLNGQVKNKVKPFVLQGQLTDCVEKNFKIYLKDKDGLTFMDTIRLDDAGNFYYKTFKVTHPQKVSILQDNLQISDMLIAPGYDLVLTGNAKDNATLYKTKKITGIGAESNNYHFILNTIPFEIAGNKRWFQLNEKEFLAYLSNIKNKKDSLATVVFDKKAIQDNYLTYFGKMIRLNNSFSQLYFLIDYTNINHYKAERAIQFVRNNFDNTILDNLFKKEFFVSDDYKDLMRGAYLKYILDKDYEGDSTLRKRKAFTLEKVNAAYQGEIKEYVLYEIIKSMINTCKSLEDLNDLQKLVGPYFSQIAKPYQKSIDIHGSAKETQLERTQSGRTAPKFTLQNDLDQSVSLTDFKGKVVYLDLWASWCGPCRAETPFLKKLNEKYKNDSRIAIISIAVKDNFDAWKKALKEDMPGGIQLIDQDDLVWNSYVLSNAIPRFIVIDKRGKVVNFDAPRPSSGKEIEKLLRDEILK